MKLRNSAILVSGGLVLAGVLASVATASTASDRWIVVTGAVAAFTAAAIALARTGLETRSMSEDSAVRRIAAVLTEVENHRKLLDVDLDLSVSVAGPKVADVAPAQVEETASAFISRLSKDPRCTVVTGQPGSGKTTVLLQLALQMAQSRENGTSQMTPLMLAARHWSPDLPLLDWITRETNNVYGITADRIRSWLVQGSGVVIIDALDEIETASRAQFVSQLNGWLRSAVGGRCVLSVRTSEYLESFSRIAADQIASLQPLQWPAVSRYLSALAIDSPAKKIVGSDIELLLSSIRETTASVNWPTPLLVRLISEGVRRYDSGAVDAAAQSDPGALAIELGDRLSESGDVTAALESYLAASRSSSNQWRSRGAVRASLLLARAGDYDRARRTLDQSIATLIEQAWLDPFDVRKEALSTDQLAILGVLADGRALDAYQVSSLASIPPSRSNQALRSLRDSGLVEVGHEENGEPKFRRSAVELAGQ